MSSRKVPDIAVRS